MLRFSWALAAVLFVFSCSAHARGGGHVTTWDPTLFGGGWVCFQAQVAGCSKGYNATCNGVADDTAALTSFRNDAIAGNPVLVKLYIPPGANCVFSTGSFNTTGNIGDPGVQNLIVWGYGANTTAVNLGGRGSIPNDSGATTDLTNQINIGDTCVTLQTIAHATNYNVGDQIALAGLSNQTFGVPANFSFYETHPVTSSNAGTGQVCFGGNPAKNQYLTTWPDLGVVDLLELGGPARIYKTEPSWNTNSQYYGLHLNNTYPQGVNITGKTIAVYDLTLNCCGYGFSGLQSVLTAWIELYEATEVDKDVEFLYSYRGHAKGFQNVSGSDNTAIYDSLVALILNGTTKNTTLINSTIATAIIGPTGFGAGNTLKMDGTTISSVVCAAKLIDTSALSFSSGTFSIANNAGQSSNAYGMFVPGHHYAFADSDGTRNNIDTPSNFTATSVGTSGSNITIGTDLGSSLPASSCNTKVPCPSYVSWPVETLTMRNSSAPGASTCAFSTN